MRKAEFKQYLMENGYGTKPFYAESTAAERADCCKKIENVFCKNLDIVALDAHERNTLLAQVSSMKRSAVKRFEDSLLAYFAFVDAGAKVTRYVPMNEDHFYRLATDMPPKSCFDMLNALEGHYETIMGWGRDLFGLERPIIQGRLERIPVVFSPVIKKKTYKADDNYKSNKIAELAREKHGEITQAEILDIMNQESFTTEIAGEFYSGYDQFGPHIVLYYNVIGGVTFEQKLANFAQVLAHEYMHYMEYRYCSANGVSFYRNEEVSEAMADFFSVAYAIKWHKCLHSGELVKVAHECYNLWKERFYSPWPYAQALLFYKVCGKTMAFSDDYTDYEIHGSIQKLVSVFCSCTDINQAYNILKNM
jgi:hypothetical protein